MTRHGDLAAVGDQNGVEHLNWVDSVDSSVTHILKTP